MLGSLGCCSYHLGAESTAAATVAALWEINELSDDGGGGGGGGGVEETQKMEISNAHITLRKTMPSGSGSRHLQVVSPVASCKSQVATLTHFHDTQMSKNYCG